MWVKICANTNLRDAQLAAELGADAVGFVFAPSKRRVDVKRVTEITERLPKVIEKVGVFATSDPIEIEHVIAATGLTVAQLHSRFQAETVRWLAAEFGDTLKIIQTVTYSVDATDRAKMEARFEAELHDALQEPALWAVLIDAAKAGASGGLGVSVDWTRAAEIIDRVVSECSGGSRIILAGGLHAENVAEATEAFAATPLWGVDVASGVEETPGQKSVERMKAFLKAARRAH